MSAVTGPEGGSFPINGSARTPPEEEPMATEELTLDLPAPVEADVAASQGGTRWSVAGCGWKKLLPDLPDDVIALLATPIVVSAQALTSGPAPTPKLPHNPAADRDQPPHRYGEPTPRFLAPAAPRRQRARLRG
jgi:hypothetical protein